MTEPTPLTFSDAQLVQALKAGPEQLQAQVAIIAMQIELTQRRASEGIEAPNAD
jgi:hypothetical protein